MAEETREQGAATMTAELNCGILNREKSSSGDDDRSCR